MNNALADMIAKSRAEYERYADDPVYLAQKAKEAADNAAECAASKDRMWRDLVAICAPVRVARLAWEPKETHAVKVATKWVEGGCATDLVLRGGVGTGKSTAAAVAVKLLLEPPLPVWRPSGIALASELSKGVTVTWLRPDSLVSAVMHAYDDKAPRLHEYIVIDDLGRETRADFAEAFCELLDREGHTLLITTNLTRDEMRQRYDLRILDRLNERASAFDIPGESMRSQKGGF